MDMPIAYNSKQQNTGFSLLFPYSRFVESHISQCYVGAKSVSSAQVSSSGSNTFRCTASKCLQVWNRNLWCTGRDRPC